MKRVQNKTITEGYEIDELKSIIDSLQPTYIDVKVTEPIQPVAVMDNIFSIEYLRGIAIVFKDKVGTSITIMTKYVGEVKQLTDSRYIIKLRNGTVYLLAND